VDGFFNIKMTTMNRSIKIPIIVTLLICSLLCFASCKKKLSLPVVTTKNVSDITQTTATAGGNITSDGNAEVSSRGVCWETSSNPTILNGKTTDGSGSGSFTSSITGLLKGTAYHLRAYATNSIGTSYGSDVLFSTTSAGDPGLVIEGTVVNNTISGTWEGVNITRNKPATFTYRNNSITSMNSQGYMLQAGDESPGSTNNNLDGEIITGNKFIWNGTNVASTITHALFVGYNINALIKYNYLYRGPTAMVLKSNGMTYTSGGVAYNIINKTGNIAVAIKGTNGINVYNNTFYSDEVKWTSDSNPGTAYGIVDIFANDGLSPWVYSTGTKIKNNIFYTVNQIYNITIEDTQDLVGFESDYNIFWCEAGTPMFNYLGTAKTFAQWQALGYDIHSRVINPNFKNLTDFVPAARLDYGTNLGSAWLTGLSTIAVWTVGSAPATTSQNGTWQVGARVF
jgi:hypothetical protein